MSDKESLIRVTFKNYKFIIRGDDPDIEIYLGSKLIAIADLRKTNLHSLIRAYYDENSYI